MVPTASIRGRHDESSTDDPTDPEHTAEEAEDDVAERVGSDHQEPNAPLPPKQLPRSANASPGKGGDPVAPLDLDAFDQMALNHVGEDELPFGITVKTMNR